MRCCLAAALLCASAAGADERVTEVTDGGARLVVLRLDGLSQGASRWTGVGLSMSAPVGGKDDVDVVFSRESPSGPLPRCRSFSLAAGGRALRFHGRLREGSAEKQVGDAEMVTGVFSATLSGRLARADLARLAAARDVTVRACGRRFRLLSDERESLADFAARARGP